MEVVRASARRSYVVGAVDHGAHGQDARLAAGQPTAGDADVEVVDLSGPEVLVVDSLVESFRRTGFALVTGHGVGQELLDAMCEVSAEFFALPLEEKLQVGFPAPEIIRGYEPVPGEADREVNLMESFLINRLDTVDDYPPGTLEHRLWRWPNIWPVRPAGLRAVYETYYGVMQALGDRLLSLVATGVGLAPEFFASPFERHFSNLVANYYPPLEPTRGDGRLRNRPHTDHGAITLLYRPSEPGGLEVFTDRRWWTVPFVPGSLVLNVGDILDRWTNGLLPATPHRVVNPNGPGAESGRQSVAYFQQPDPGAVISPVPGLLGSGTGPRYVEVTAGWHISIKEFGAAALESFRGPSAVKDRQPHEESRG